jgi:hypothetical protein
MIQLGCQMLFGNGVETQMIIWKAVRTIQMKGSEDLCKMAWHYSTKQKMSMMGMISAYLHMCLVRLDLTQHVCRTALCPFSNKVRPPKNILDVNISQDNSWTGVSVTAGMHSPLEQQVLLVECTCYKVLIINGVNLCRQHMYEVGLKTNYSNVDNHSCLMYGQN